MFAVLHAFGRFAADPFKSRCRLEAENLLLRHQLTIALRRKPLRLRLRGSDRALLACMTRLWPSLLDAIQVVQAETVLRWHRAGFQAFWRWKSRNRAGRPRIDRALRDLIQQMENPLWGASRTMANSSSLDLRWPSRRSRNTWRDLRSRRRKAGRRFYGITLRQSPPLICALCGR
jgi:hypothetical protein